MAYERDKRLRHFAMEPQANRSRTEEAPTPAQLTPGRSTLTELRASRPAQLTPGRSTLTELLDPVEVACVFDTQLEIAARQLAALEAANHAGDHYGSAVAASGLRTALTLAGTAVIRTRAKSEEHAATLSRRLTGACEAARPALEQAFTPSIAARRELVEGTGRAQWDLDVARWRAARGRTGLETASDARAPESIGAGLALVHAIKATANEAGNAGAFGAPPVSLHVGRGEGAPKAPAPKVDDAKKGTNEAAALGAWAGAGASGRIFRNDTSETYVDGATGDSVEVRTDWMLAEFESFELKTNTALEVEREIHIRLARGVTVLAISRARAWLHADRLPNDVHAALHAPARLIRHDGSILVIDDKGAHLLSSFPHPFAREQSVVSHLGAELMLGFEADGPQRIRDAERFSAETVPQHGANMEAIAAILRDAPQVTLGLRHYVKAKLAYESPPIELLASGRHMIHRIEALTSGTWTGYEGSALLFQLQAMWAGFTRLVASAERAKPAEKDFWDHAADAARAIGAAIVGVGVAVKELVLMTRDLGLWLADEVANLFGSDVDWSAASGIGKAYQSGKSTGEIFTAMVDGIVDAWDKAIEHAGNGDYSKLMNLGAELALDIAIGVATSGAATPALMAERAGAGARMAGRVLALTEEAAEALAARTRATLAKGRYALDAVPATARKTAHDLHDALQGLLDGLTQAKRIADTGTGKRMVVFDPGAIPRAIQRVRAARAMESARSAVAKLRGQAARNGESVLRRLGQLADKPRMADAIDAMARQIAKSDDKARLVGMLDRVLGAWPPSLDTEVLARVVRRAADAREPVKYLDDAAWVMGHKGLSAAAREGLMRHAVRSTNPLDLRWLRELTELPDEMLEFMALDVATHWKELMKVSTRPSDYFPSSVRKLLTPDDYARAGGKLRGIAGELIFVVEGIELPGGLKIVARQVDAHGKKIDFGLRNAHGQKAKLEVKAWSRKTWERELPNLRSKAELSSRSLAGRMIEQLEAAGATGERVYLAVSDVISDLAPGLRGILKSRGLDLTVITFPESKLKNAMTRLKVGLGLTAGVALVTADQIMETYDE
jgi:hypothetical protein